MVRKDAKSKTENLLDLELAMSDDMQPDINNHHSIPKESWNNNQNPTSPATTTTQENDAAAASVTKKLVLYTYIYVRRVILLVALEFSCYEFARQLVAVL